MRRMTKKKAAVLILCVLSALNNAVHAESMPLGEEQGLLSYQLDSLVVTATRSPLEEKKIPNVVQVIRREQIENLGATDIFSALRLADNLNLSKGMAGNNVMLRGMSTNHTLILVDGKRSAGEDTAVTTNVYALQRISLSNVERIEILRGTASALYGSDALGGVINIITRKPKKPELTVGLATGTDEINNYYHYDFGKQGKFSGTLDARFIDLRKKIYKSGSSSYFGPRQEYSFKGIWDLGKTKELELGVGFYKDKTHNQTADEIRKGMYVKKDTQEWNDFLRQEYSLEYRGLTEGGDYMLRTYYSNLKKENENFHHRPLFPGKMEKMLGGMYHRYDFDKSQYSILGVEGKNTTKLNRRHTLTWGGEYRHTGGEGTRIGEAGDHVYIITQNGKSKFYSDKTISTYAGYLQDVITVNDKLMLIPSVRYDHDNTFGGEVSPKVGAAYSLSENSRIKVNWGKGFKAPTISEMYFAMHRSMGGMMVNVYGNPNLKPEKNTSWDVSLEAEKGKTHGKLTWFHNDVNNLIASAHLPGGGKYDSYYVNINKAKIQGMETLIGHEFNRHWSTKVTYSYLDAKDKNTKEFLNNRARHNGTVQLAYSDGTINPFKTILWAEYCKDYHYNEGKYSYTTLNLTMNKVINRDLRVYAGIDNLFNKRYENEDTGFDTAGRVWRLGAEMKF